MTKKLLVLLIGVMLTPSAALAVSTRVFFSNPGDLENCTAADLTGTTTCGGATGYRLNGSNVATFILGYTHGAGGAYTCDVESLDDVFGAWGKVQAQKITDGVVAMTDLKLTKSGLGADHVALYTLQVNYDSIRLVCSGGGAGSTLQAQIRRAFSPDN